jgi:hypothetical protein
MDVAHQGDSRKSDHWLIYLPFENFVFHRPCCVRDCCCSSAELSFSNMTRIISYPTILDLYLKLRTIGTNRANTRPMDSKNQTKVASAAVLGASPPHSSRLAKLGLKKPLSSTVIPPNYPHFLKQCPRLKWRTKTYKDGTTFFTVGDVNC